MDIKLVLTYWDIRGLAERIRLILEYLGIEYEDRCLSNRDEWLQKIKPSINDPFINLPYLKDGDKIISESEAVIAYIIFKADRSDLYGKDNCQKVEVIKLRGAFNDMYTAYIKAVYNGGDFAQQKPALVENLKKHLTKFQKYIGKSDYLCGDLTYMDFLMGEFCDVLQRMEPGLIKNNFQGIHQLMNRIWSLPAIAKYKDSKFIPMPCNAPFAVWGGGKE